ncbi:IGF-like family receptor 1 isoform X2 [Chelonia mydas]|uniref:IGF-like family receptor 1 isoform X2 n=1 Tax=Chelonia mydas TaxID=8469 RepID=UPI001CA99F04|nr:IGF-like family receptor 1 isoform X2 [Chelonia mydas]
MHTWSHCVEFTVNCGMRDTGGRFATPSQACPPGSFNDGQFLLCQPCSRCPPGTQLSPCTPLQDTQCCPPRQRRGPAGRCQPCCFPDKQCHPEGRANVDCSSPAEVGAGGGEPASVRAGVWEPGRLGSIRTWARAGGAVSDAFIPNCMALPFRLPAPSLLPPLGPPLGFCLQRYRGALAMPQALLRPPPLGPLSALEGMNPAGTWQVCGVCQRPSWARPGLESQGAPPIPVHPRCAHSGPCWPRPEQPGAVPMTHCRPLAGYGGYVALLMLLLVLLAGTFALLVWMQRGLCPLIPQASSPMAKPHQLLPPQSADKTSGIIASPAGHAGLWGAPLQHLLDNVDVLEELIMLLDPEGKAGGGTRHLAARYGLSATWIDYAYSLRSTRSPLRATLETVAARQPDATLGQLAGLLAALGRKDALQVLERVQVGV